MLTFVCVFCPFKTKMAYSWPKLLILIVYSGVIWDLSKEEPGDCQFLKGRIIKLFPWRITHLQNWKGGGEGTEAEGASKIQDSYGI